jgi:hypothetical protein
MDSRPVTGSFRRRRLTRLSGRLLLRGSRGWKRFYKDGSPVPLAVLVAFKRPKGAVGTPDELWLPKKFSLGF